MGHEVSYATIQGRFVKEALRRDKLGLRQAQLLHLFEFVMPCVNERQVWFQAEAFGGNGGQTMGAIGQTAAVDNLNGVVNAFTCVQ